jgi:uncharacterized protein YyaL (SSP411 family)
MLGLWLCANPQTSPANADPAGGNALSNHPSPYLALHAGDPVDWRIWGSSSLDAAHEAGRLIFVSVGYFSCHWCHVMQRESYQNEKIAQVLNRGFVAIKVDRELQPALDQQLIEFVETVRGSAGWPLNVFLTPAGYPLTGFTYLPPDEFLAVLEKLEKEWQDNHEALSRAAERVYVKQLEETAGTEFITAQFPAGRLTEAYVSQAMLLADELQGGFGNTSKFPSVPQLSALLQAIGDDPGIDPDVPEFARLTLTAMAAENLHDHVNGGFFRYTTDPDWQTPHFEKMLYDNAQLAALYFQAHALWPASGFADVGLRTLDFVEAALSHADGGYMSSLSAVDDQGVEGKGYFWTRTLLAEFLDPAELDYLADAWQLDTRQSEFLARPLIGPGASGDPSTNAAILRKLRQRGQTEMPADDKRLASWNAMMLKALVAAAAVEPDIAPRARRQFEAMRAIFHRDGELMRLANNADVAAAVFEDYAEVAHAYLRYGAHFDHGEARELAARLAQTAMSRFLVDNRWQAGADAAIPAAHAEWVVADTVFFSPMTQWLEVMFLAPGVDAESRAFAREMANRVNADMLESPYYYGSYILLNRPTTGG